jgi:hypothetical protein
MRRPMPRSCSHFRPRDIFHDTERWLLLLSSVDGSPRPDVRCVLSRCSGCRLLPITVACGDAAATLHLARSEPWRNTMPSDSLESSLPKRRVEEKLPFPHAESCCGRAALANPEIPPVTQSDGCGCSPAMTGHHSRRCDTSYPWPMCHAATSQPRWVCLAPSHDSCWPQASSSHHARRCDALCPVGRHSECLPSPCHVTTSQPRASNRG